MTVLEHALRKVKDERLFDPLCRRELFELLMRRVLVEVVRAILLRDERDHPSVLYPVKEISSVFGGPA